jgi:hypothetical protein
MQPLKKTVTTTVNVSPRIADLVYFARSLANRDIKSLSDGELIELAECFWDTEHGEDD